jgi:hypothetical protein
MSRSGPAPVPQSAVARVPPRTIGVATDAIPPVPVSIHYHDRLVGSTHLEFPLAPDAIGGRLRPGPSLPEVWRVFQLYELVRVGSLDADHFVRARDDLRLYLLDRDGAWINARVDLISHWGGSRWMVHLRLR